MRAAHRKVRVSARAIAVATPLAAQDAATIEDRDGIQAILAIATQTIESLQITPAIRITQDQFDQRTYGSAPLSAFGFDNRWRPVWLPRYSLEVFT